MHAAAQLTPYFDVAQLALWAFWIFFAGLVVYLQRESTREGFPLVSDKPGRIGLQEPAVLPAPKTFLLKNGTTVLAPRFEEPEAEPKAVPSAGFPGAPLIPTGDPLVDGVGPAAWANRTDVADIMWETGEPRIVPMRVDPAYFVAPEDPNPVGFDVIGCDDMVAGQVVDTWVDRSETVIRYLEIKLTGSGKIVLAPLAMSVVKGKARQVKIRSITSTQFFNVPTLRNAEQITRLEEDKICAYYAGGTLYATAARQEPLL